MMMYTTQDLENLNGQIKRRYTALGIPAVLMLAGIVFSVLPHVRMQWLTVALTIAMIVMGLFGHGLFIAPLLKYRVHLDSALNGRRHDLSCTFKSLELTPCLREGVMFYPMIVSAGDPKEPEDDRLLYYDLEKPLPDLKEGEKLHIVYHDKSIMDLRKEA